MSPSSAFAIGIICGLFLAGLAVLWSKLRSRRKETVKMTTCFGKYEKGSETLISAFLHITKNGCTRRYLASLTPMPLTGEISGEEPRKGIAERP